MAATCLVDGFSLRECTVPHRAVIEGDGTSAAIAAASVIAKVTRDRYMHRAAAQHPGWGFEEHVGYSTPEHREAIERIGISPLHRRSFQSVAYSPARARRLERGLDVLDVGRAAGAVEADADGVEADLRRSGADRGVLHIQATARRRTRCCLRRSTARTGRSGP